MQGKAEIKELEIERIGTFLGLLSRKTADFCIMESPTKPQARVSHVSSPLPPVLQRLRSENEHLRQQLRDYSTQLDSLISQMPRKSLNLAEIHKKEVANARKQLEMYEKQLKDLQKTQSHMSPTKCIDLESVLEAISQEIKAKEANIRSLRRVEQDRSSALRSLSADSEGFSVLKAATSALRGARQSVGDVEREIARGEETYKTVTAKLLHLEGKYKEIVGIERVESDEPKAISVDSADISQRKAAVKDLDRKKNSSQSTYRRDIGKAEEQLALLQRELQTVHIALRDKEREGRVLALAVKESSKTLQNMLKKEQSLDSEVRSQSKSQAFLTETES